MSPTLARVHRHPYVRHAERAELVGVQFPRPVESPRYDVPTGSTAQSPKLLNSTFAPSIIVVSNKFPRLFARDRYEQPYDAHLKGNGDINQIQVFLFYCTETSIGDTPAGSKVTSHYRGIAQCDTMGRKVPQTSYYRPSQNCHTLRK